MEVKICVLPGLELTKTNIIYHGDETNKNEYIVLSNVLYKTKYHNKVQIDSIALNNVLRQKQQLAIGDIIKIQYKTFSANNCVILTEIKILITKHTKRNVDIILDDAKIPKYLFPVFNNYIICKNQCFIVEIEGVTYKVDILGLENDIHVIGMINNDTKFIQYVGDNIKLSKSRLIPRNIFSPDFSFSTVGIGGLGSELDCVLKEALALRAIDPKIVKELGAKYVKGMILYGPPGTGKTLIARQLGKLLTIKTPKIINGPELFNKYVGQSEENVRNVFRDAIAEYEEKGDNSDLHIIIFDEIDALCRARGGNDGIRVGDNVLTQLLTMLDGTNIQLSNIFVIGMTNRMDLLDPALLRPGRLEIHVKIDLPNIDGRKEIFNIYINKIHEKYIPNKINLDQLCELTANFSGAEIEAVVKKACSIAANDSLVKNNNDIIITHKYFLDAINTINPAFGKNIPLLDYYKENDKIHNILPILIEDKRFKLFSYIIHGERYSGKTDSLLYLAKKSNIIFTKMIRPIDVIQMDDYSKSSYIMSIVKDAYLSDKSLILIDDIDIIMNFSDIMGIVNYSNKILQTILTIIKTNKPNLSVICTCSNYNLFNNLKLHFTENIEF